MPIKQKALAERWGVSAVYVNKLVGKGCPLDSFEAADKWRGSRRVASKRGPKKKAAAPPPEKPAADPAPPRKAKKAAPAIPVAPPAPPPPEVAGEKPPETKRGKAESLDTLHQALLASIAVQTGAYELVLESIHGPAELQEWLANRIAAYNKATEGRLKTESEVQELEVKAGRLLPYEEHTALLSRALMPLFSRLFSLGKRVAVKANPNNPVLAEKEITAAIKDACRDSQSEAFPVKWEDMEQLQQPEQ